MKGLKILKQRILAVALALSLLGSVTYVGQTAGQEVELEFIDIDLSGTANANDFPFGIDCNDPENVWVTIFNQGGLVKIDKDTKQVVAFFNDPEGSVASGQGFYDIQRDPINGNLFINERDNGKVWRFEPATTTWTRIVILPQIVHPKVDYPSGFEVKPYRIRVDESAAPGAVNPPFHFGSHTYDFIAPSFGGVAYASGFIWVGLTFNFNFDDFANHPNVGVNDISFSGLARIDPATLEVTRIPIEGAGFIASMSVDFLDGTSLLIPDRTGDKVYKFDTNTLQVVQTISLPAGSKANHVDSDSTNIYVALNKGSGGNSEIAMINRFTDAVTIIDTTAPNTNFGTFTVFAADEGFIVWSDQSRHIGTIDLNTNEKEFDTTAFANENHFLCVAVEDEAWVAGRGSARVGIKPNSKFSVGGVKRATGRGGSDPVARGDGFAFGDPNSANYDSQPPVIGDVTAHSGSLKVSAQVFDNVAVMDVNLIVGKDVYPMNPHDGNPLWWDGEVPSSEGEVSYRIVARDFNLNVAEYTGSATGSGGSAPSAGEGARFSITMPSLVGHQMDQLYSIVAKGVTVDAPDANPQITISNTGTESLNNIRIVLSSELKGKFLLSDYAIKSIAPNSAYTVTLKLNGNPNVSVMKEPIPYNGQIIITVDNHSPVVLTLTGNIPNESSSLQSLFMKMITSKAEDRYRNFQMPDLRISNNAEYEVTLASGETAIKNASDELIITNSGNKPLSNVRIMTVSLSDHFLPEQKNVEFVPAGSFVRVKLVSMLNDAVSRDLQGELLVVPEYGAPVKIPIEIEKRLPMDKNAMYEIKTISGNDEISNTADGIVITNKSKESIDSVRVILPRDLARVFSLSEYSFKSIEPNSEKTIHLQQRGTIGSNVKQILNDYSGAIIIVSSDGMKKIVPVNIAWKGISSEHFVIYARDKADELAKATQVINFLERSYAQVTEMIDEPRSKTVIYMTSSMDELKMLSNALAPSTFVYDEDVGFVWSDSEDVNMLALKEFVHRTIMQNYGTYWAKQKISIDRGNWLIDGVADYAVAKIVGEKGLIKEHLDAFIHEPVSLHWYDNGTPSQYGASYTFIKYLTEKYGEKIIDKTLQYLGTGTMGSHRCDTLEDCALLRAVYDINGLDVSKKNYTLDVGMLVKGWEDYVKEHYGVALQRAD